MAVPEWQNALPLQLDFPGLTGTVTSEKKLNTGSENGERGRGREEEIEREWGGALAYSQEKKCHTRSLL